MKEEIEKFFMELTEEEQDKAIELMKVKHDQDKLSRGVCLGKGKKERPELLRQPSEAEGKPCPLLQKRGNERRFPNLIFDRCNPYFCEDIP